jgi:hypothetical protein
MALFNEILAGRFNRFAQKHFSMKGSGTGTPTLSADVQLNLSFISGLENAYLQGWDLFGVQTSQAAGGAGNIAQVRIRNPVGSGMVVVVYRCTATSLTAGTAQYSMQRGTATTDFAALAGTTGLRKDARSIRGGPMAIVSSQNTTPLTSLTNAASHWSGYVTAPNTLEVLSPAIDEPILPGDAMQVWNNIANQDVIVSLWWRERALEDSEKA